jgi:hypothetical protein
LTLGLWGILLLGIQAGSIGQVLNPGIPVAFFQGLRAVLPLVAGSLGLFILLTKLSRDRSAGFLFVGPLGLAALYGLVGLASAFFSPDGTVALYWTAAYVSVPLVLWAIVWGNDALDSAGRIVYLNWLIVILAVAALFVAAILYLKLGTVILTPSLWLDCKLNAAWGGESGSWEGNSWYKLTSGALRPTGVGRYAAIAAIVALGGLWQGRWRYLWGAVLVAAGVLLLTSGARTSFIGIAVAAPLVVLLHGGKRAALAGLVVIALLVPLVWGTGIHRDFLNLCLRVGSIRTAEAAASEEGTSSGKSITLSGRTIVWTDGWRLFKESPLLGWGFHADRLILGTHLHNAFLHALVQTGIVGAIPFMAALILGWVLLYKALRNRAHLPGVHRHLVIQTAGILTFLSVRAITESTGAFFGVDWLILAPLLLYLQAVNRYRSGSEPAP